jgi:hypothetical protein
VVPVLTPPVVPVLVPPVVPVAVPPVEPPFPIWVEPPVIPALVPPVLVLDEPPVPFGADALSLQPFIAKAAAGTARPTNHRQLRPSLFITGSSCIKLKTLTRLGRAHF